MTIRLRIFFLYFLFLSLASSGASAQQSAADNTLLWQVSGKGLKEPSFLFGSYHLIGKDFIDTLPGIGKSYAKAKAVVGEIVLDDPMAMAQKMMPYMLLNGNTLDKLLKPAEYAEIESFFKEKTGMGLAMFNGMKPSVIQVTLITEVAEKTISDTNPPLDLYFQDQAKKDKKEIIGLETMESQAEILFNTPVERQKQQLFKLVRGYQKSYTESKQVFEFYKAQNMQELAKAFLKTEDYTAEEMDVLLNNRNKNWVKGLPAIMSKQPAFIIVGAGHLVGPMGLISLLKKEGYTVEPLNTRE